jgi:hypothetical protein
LKRGSSARATGRSMISCRSKHLAHNAILTGKIPHAGRDVRIRGQHASRR